MATEYKINEQCIVGLPSCGYGFSSARMCFIARPADDEFKLEEEVLAQLLKDRTYDSYVALQKLDPGNFAFCQKICSKIIQSHFCIVLLNESTHAENANIKIPNPNVHLEYGMMLSFHKHVIPMQLESEDLAFNIAPLDTVKYTKGNFKEKAEQAIDEMILRVSINEPPGRPIEPVGDVLKYMSFRGLRFTDLESDNIARAVYRLGGPQGFSLFDGTEGILFYGYFHQDELREIAVRTKFLLNNIAIARKRVSETGTPEQQQEAEKILAQLKIEILVPEDSDVAALSAKIEEFQSADRKIPVEIRKPSEVEAVVKEEYEGIGL